MIVVLLVVFTVLFVYLIRETVRMIREARQERNKYGFPITRKKGGKR